MKTKEQIQLAIIGLEAGVINDDPGNTTFEEKKIALSMCKAMAWIIDESDEFDDVFESIKEAHRDGKIVINDEGKLIIIE
jgi:hypothetical protein